jgi:sulfate adenylyltransferase subunit 1 (EFTu-like GTPase family)
MSVTVRLADDVDVSRGDMIARVKNAPTPSQDIDAMICWMTNEPLRRVRSSRSSTRPARGARWSRTSNIAWTSTPCTATRRANELGLNEIGRVQLRTTVRQEPAAVRPMIQRQEPLTTAGFVHHCRVIDEATGVT